MNALNITVSLVSVVSCTYTITLLSREWARRFEYAKEMSGVHQQEIEILERVVHECAEIADCATDTPRSIQDAFLTCKSRRDDLKTMLNAALATDVKVKRSSFWTFTQTFRLSLGKKDLKRRYAMFRQSVLLLRDLCSE